MAKRRQSTSGYAGGASGAAQYLKLEHLLVLLAWLTPHWATTLRAG